MITIGVDMAAEDSEDSSAFAVVVCDPVTFKQELLGMFVGTKTSKNQVLVEKLERYCSSDWNGLHARVFVVDNGLANIHGNENFHVFVFYNAVTALPLGPLLERKANSLSRDR